MSISQPTIGYPLYGASHSQVSAGVRRLTLIYLWFTIAAIAVVFSEPAPFDAFMVGACILLPLVGLTRFTRGLSLYIILWSGIVIGGLFGATQAGIVDVPIKHVATTFYLAASSVVMAAFVTQRPQSNVELIMSAYVPSAIIAAICGLIGYFSLVPGAYDLFTEYGRARGTFKDPNVLGAFLVPALIYSFNVVLTAKSGRALLWTLAMPMLLFGSLLSFSRGAWINLGVSLFVYSLLIFATAATNLQRMKLVISVILAASFAVGLFAAAQSIPKIADLMGERAELTQDYDVGPEGRFGGHKVAANLILEHPLGIGALEFARLYHNEDVHEVYLNMFLNTGWLGGPLYIFLVLLTLFLGVRQVIRDRGGTGLSAVLTAAFFGQVFEGVIIDSDHWRHYYLLMAMIWGMALAGSLKSPAPSAARLAPQPA